MLRSVYLKTLRDLRWGVLGWGGGLGVLVVVTAVAWAKAYPDEASRVALMGQIRGALSVAQAIYGPPHDVDRLGGFIEWRVLGLAPVLLGLYLILAATSMTRGAEESRTIEVVAATPRARSRLLLEQIAALVTGLAVAAALIGLLTLAAGSVSGEPAPQVGRVAATSANVAAAALMFGGLGLLAAQLFARRRTAALAASGVMVLCHLTNTLPLVEPGLGGMRYASPLYLYTRSSPLSNGNLEWLAFTGLVLVAVALGGLAFLASARRDLFDTYHRRRQVLREPEPAPANARIGPARPGFLFRNGLARGLRDAFGASVGWAAGLGLLAVLMTALTPRVREALLEQHDGPLFRQLERAGLTSERGIVSALLFSFLPPLVTVFGVTLAASWAGDELGGRLELELAAPVPRWRAFVQRWAAAVALQGVALAGVALAMVVTIEASGVDVPVGAVGAALWTLLVLAACMVSVGFATAGWKPGLTAALAGAFVAVSYFANLLIPLLELPGWVRYVSIFGLYGSPLADGVTYWRVGVLLAATVAFAAVGAAAFQRRDIVR